jgi:hypothetical protein
MSTIAITIIIVVICVFILLVGGIFYYYYRQSNITPSAPIPSAPTPGSTVSTLGGNYTPSLSTCTPNQGEGCIVSSLVGNAKITGQYKIQPGETITTLTVGPYTGAQIFGSQIYDYTGSLYSNSTSTLDFSTLTNSPNTISLTKGTPPPSAQPTISQSATPAPSSSSTPAPVPPPLNQTPHLSLGSSF